MNKLDRTSPNAVRLAWTVDLLAIVVAFGMFLSSFTFGGGLASTLLGETLGILASALLLLAVMVTIAAIAGTEHRRLVIRFWATVKWTSFATLLLGVGLYVELSNDPLAGLSGPILIGYAAAAACITTVAVFLATRWTSRST